jgi:hypothetical protein
MQSLKTNLFQTQSWRYGFSFWREGAFVKVSLSKRNCV